MRTGTQSMCGCYYMPAAKAYESKQYLPQIDLKSHTTVISNASSTVLSQTFVNPSSTIDVKECRYVFPLYDGVSVVNFTCQVGPRIIKGIVKEKAKAKEEYNAAVERGETAGLLEQGPTSDIFMTNLGNVPAGEQLLVTITFIGELKYDMGAGGIRFTLPTRISPRYGQAGNQTNPSVSKGGIAITVDVQMAENSPLQAVRSPSHPIAVALGRTSASESQSPHLSRASATLSLGTSTLDKDFVLEIIQDDSGKSKAFLETHPTISGQRALMATLVLDAPIQQSKPEIIFVADQSGSMQGARTKTLVAALRIFLKSLPIGAKFNICYFGSSHSFLFPVSQVYDQQSLEKALKSLNGLDGEYGGTETLSAIRASIESRDNKQPLSLILATDGDIWQQQELFDYLNDSVAGSREALRVFALGIGNSVSSALVEGVARAGNGFAQSVGEGEKLDGKVIRMLRGALTPDHGALTMEIQYKKDDDDEDGFVMVERVSDSLRVLGLVEDDWLDAQLGDEPVVSAATTATGAKDAEMPNADGQARYDHLPAVPAPKLMQTPQNIPSLYPFSRTNVYVLMSPDAAQGTIKSVILKGSSAEIPFELEVSIEVLPERTEIIHQIAAKKAITELEEGRGWLVYAEDEKGVPIKEKHSAHFQSMVEREVVRLGIQYQIAGKFTSFVATETVLGSRGSTVTREAGIIEGADSSPSRIQRISGFGAPASGALLSSTSSKFGAPASGALLSSTSSKFGAPASGALLSSTSSKFGAPASGGGLFGGSTSQTLKKVTKKSEKGTSASGGGLFSGFTSPNFGAPASRGLFGGSMANTPAPSGESRSATSTQQQSYNHKYKRSSAGETAPHKQFASMAASKSEALPSSAVQTQGAPSYEEMDAEAEESDPLQKLIALQTFEGCWNMDARLLEVVGFSAQHKAPQDTDSKVWATVLAITFLERRMAGDKEVWVMVVEKARGWLKDMEGTEDRGLEDDWTLAKQLILGAD